MLERQKDLPRGIEGLKAVGTLSKEDYERTFEPLIEDARREGKRLRLLYQLGPDFEGFTAGAAWEDAKLGLRSLRLFDGCAIVTDTPWIREAKDLFEVDEDAVKLTDTGRAWYAAMIGYETADARASLPLFARGD